MQKKSQHRFHLFYEWSRILGQGHLLGISNRGNKKILTLLVQCAGVFIQKLEHQSGKLSDRVRNLPCRKSNFVVTCDPANQLARIAWAQTARQQTYEASRQKYTGLTNHSSGFANADIDDTNDPPGC
ncbi:Transposase (plasmid) [Erwinia billingiae Eb661]|uniref:Transposase n=1 Tax=Erwinia billingiae (strain Eb661) TaxID=634500 RepID=D8MJN6_ERWBE|nr:Transposase [Erwinia billingiae Eb661]